MTILYSNGCSYTANYNIERSERYPILIAKHFKWMVQDKAIPGNCNSKIIRSAMRDCVSLLKQEKPIVAMIQLTHQERFEYAGKPTKENAWKYGLLHDQVENIDKQIFDQFESINPMDEKHWPKEIVQYAKQHLILQKIDALNTNLFHSIIGLASFFRTNNIKYLIYAGPSFYNPEIDNDPFYRYLLNDKNVIDLNNFNMLSITGLSKHPDSSGMKKIADYFINLLAEPK